MWNCTSDNFIRYFALLRSKVYQKEIFLKYIITVGILGIPKFNAVYCSKINNPYYCYGSSVYSQEKSLVQPALRLGFTCTGTCPSGILVTCDKECRCCKVGGSCNEAGMVNCSGTSTELSTGLSTGLSIVS
jgi:hypothetical protein